METFTDDLQTIETTSTSTRSKAPQHKALKISGTAVTTSETVQSVDPVHSIKKTIDALLRLGLSPVPVAPCNPDIKKKDGKLLFTGKNPSYLDKNGRPHLVTHGDYKTQQPTQADINLWWANPNNGVGSLGSETLVWVDVDRKQFSDSDSCDRVYQEWLRRFPVLNEAWKEKTQSGGYRVLVEVDSKPSFTNFSFEGEGGKHHGECLGLGRYAVLGPTKGTSDTAIQDYSLIENQGGKVNVGSLESIGLCEYSAKESVNTKVKAKTTSTSVLTVTSEATPINPDLAPISLLELLAKSTQAILDKTDLEALSDRSDALTKCINEIYGWKNWLTANGIAFSPSAEDLFLVAVTATGSDDKGDRVLETVNLDTVVPACFRASGSDLGPWQQVKNVSIETFEAKCPIDWKALVQVKKDEWKASNLESNLAATWTYKPEQAQILHDKFNAIGKTFTEYQWRILTVTDFDKLVKIICYENQLPIEKPVMCLVEGCAYDACRKILEQVPEVTDLSGCKGYYWLDYLKRFKKATHDTLAIHKVYGSSIRYNTLRMQPEVNGKEVFLDDLKAEMETNHRETLIQGKDEAISAFMTLAKKSSYNPVTEYLDRCKINPVEGLTAETILIKCFNLDPKMIRVETWTLYIEYIKRFLIGAVARAYEPGIKHRTVLVLKGGQYTGKSDFFGILGGTWFDDSVSMNSEKDDKLKMNRAWICEWQEIESIIGKKSTGEAKAWIASSVDRVRPPYERAVKDMPRPSVIGASVNETTFLTDTTGNSRYWVIDTGDNYLDRDWLKENRDAIWAYAVDLHESGCKFWFDTANTHDMALFALQNKLNEDYATVDPWEAEIEAHLDGISETTMRSITRHLELSIDRQNKGTESKIGKIMNKLGWFSDKNQTRVNGDRVKLWRNKASSTIPLVDVNEPF